MIGEHLNLNVTRLLLTTKEKPGTCCRFTCQRQASERWPALIALSRLALRTSPVLADVADPARS